MNLAELFKKNIVMIPVVVSILVGTFTGIKYVINLHRHNQQQQGRDHSTTGGGDH